MGARQSCRSDQGARRGSENSGEGRREAAQGTHRTHAQRDRKTTARFNPGSGPGTSGCGCDCGQCRREEGARRTDRHKFQRSADELKRSSSRVADMTAIERFDATAQATDSATVSATHPNPKKSKRRGARFLLGLALPVLLALGWEIAVR